MMIKYGYIPQTELCHVCYIEKSGFDRFYIYFSDLPTL